MASYFGEVIEPHSRSFVTDGEECTLEERYDIVTIKGDLDEANKGYEYLIIASGKILHEFSTSYLISSNGLVLEKYNIVSKPDENGRFSRLTYPSTLYHLSDTTALFVCEKLPHPYFANCLLTKLKPWLERSNNVVVLTSETMVNFKPIGSTSPFIRSLRTAACSFTPVAPNLELPNTITGLPAAVLSWCQFFKKSAVMYILYVESSHLDSITADPLLHLLRQSPSLKLQLPSATTLLRNIAHKAELYDSNIYM